MSLEVICDGFRNVNVEARMVAVCSTYVHSYPDGMKEMEDAGQEDRITTLCW